MPAPGGVTPAGSAAVPRLLARPHHDPSPLYCQDDAPGLGDVVDVRVHVPHGDPVRDVVLRVVRDGEPHLESAVPDGQDSAGTWWRARLHVVNPLSSYRFFLHGADGSYSWLNGTGRHRRDVPDAHDFRLVAGDAAPAWATDAVVYQVFPDRFARSGESHARPDWALPSQWDDPVIHRGAGVAQQWFGGDLAGIEHHLDHVSDLAASVLYLTPVFEGRSNHRYDAVSFDRADPLLGGDAALSRLVSAAHRRGMRVIGDLTTNHTGREHEWFVAAQADPTSPEAGFYRFRTHPGDYEAWLEVPTLPKLDHTSAELRRRLYGPDSVVARWLREPIGLDGWRIDVANMTGRLGADDVALEVARTLRSTMRAVNPDTWLVAEHGHDFSADVLGGGWHGSMNYSGFTRPVWAWLSSSGHGLNYLGLPVQVPSLPGTAVARTIRDFTAVTPWRSLRGSLNLLCSHDTPRVRTIVGSRERQVVALALLATLPGVPMVFSGDELGMTGTDGEDARRPFPWQSRRAWDEDLLASYRFWLTLRRSQVALRRGGIRWVHAGADSLTFLREHPDERLLVHVARADHAAVVVPRYALGLSDELRGRTGLETLAGDDATCEDGHTLTLPSRGPNASVYHLGRSQ